MGEKIRREGREATEIGDMQGGGRFDEIGRKVREEVREPEGEGGKEGTENIG